MRKHRFADQKGPPRVDAKHAIPLVGLNLLDAMVRDDAGIVDEHVDGAVIGNRLLDHRRDRIRVAHISRRELAPPADREDRLAQSPERRRLGSEIIGKNEIGFGGEAAGDGAPDAAARAGHKNSTVPYA